MYKHSHFSLDPHKREVRDENGKRLRITGNPYRLLELLCDRHPTSLTITDINLAFDPAGAREYTEAHVRQMKNLIHTALGSEVIRYRNKVYSLIAELEKAKADPATKPKLKFLSVEKIGKSLRLHARTPDGGEIFYTNKNFEGRV
jgi:hypothetical protein